MRVVFFGSDTVAVPALELLAKQTWCELVTVITQPAKPIGRKQVLQPTKIAQLAERLGLSAQTDQLTVPTADVAVVVDYGRIIPEVIQSQFMHGIINIHPSLLPRWRGPSPIQSALVAGDTTTGVSIMRIDNGVDTGPLLIQQSVDIDITDTAIELEQRLAKLGAELLVQTLPDYVAGTITPTSQSVDNVVLSHLLKRADGELTNTMSATELWNRYRGLQPWPGVYSMVNGKRLKIVEAHWANRIVVDKVQLEGKQPMLLADFKRGYPTFSLPF